MPINLNLIDIDNIEDQDQSEPDRVKSNFSEALKVNPVQHAEDVRLAGETGVPAFAVDESVKHSFDLGKIQFNNLAKDNPKTSKFLTGYDNAVIAQDDVDVLKSIEDVFNFSKTFEGIGESIAVGFEAQGAGLGLAGVDLSSNRIQDIVPMSALPIGMEMEAFEISRNVAANFGITTDDQLKKAKEEMTTKMLGQLRELHETRSELTPDDLNTLEQGVRGGIESLGTMAPGFALMLLSGGRAAPLLTTMGLQTFGDSYGSGRSEGLTPQKASFFAGIDAAIEVGTEMLPTKTLETIITGGSTGMTKSALKFMVQEMGTEQLATLGQSLNAYAFGLDEQLQNAETIDEKVDIQLQRQAVTAIATVVAGGAQAGVATGIRKTIDALSKTEEGKETGAEIQKRKLDALDAAASQSTTRERSKDSFKQFVAQVATEEDSDVFIDSVQASLYLQTKTPAEISNDEALSLLQEKVKESSDTGVDVQIPIEDFATDIAGTEHYAQLKDSMTLNSETNSTFRQEQVTKDTQNYVQGLLDEAEESGSQYVEAQEIYNTVRDQLVDTGQVNQANANFMAQIVPAWATAQAQRQGIGVKEVYENSGLVIEGPQTGERARLEGDQILTQAKETGFEGENVVEASEWQQAVDKGLDMSQDARLQRAADMGFDTEQILYHGTADDIDVFRETKVGKAGNGGVYFTNSPDQASNFADIADRLDGRGNGKSPNVIPAYVALDNPFVSETGLPLGEDVTSLIVKGHDGIILKGEMPDGSDEVVVFDPANIRSVNAAFDPDFKESGDLLAQSEIEPVQLKDEGDVDKVETGKPVTFNFTHNTESATGIFGLPEEGDTFGRDFEPAARFVNVASKKRSDEADNGFIGGTLTFYNPLVVPANGIKWKEELSKQYGGKTGKKLSKALIADGYDGVITTDEKHISETIDLTTFDESKALFQSPVDEKNLFVAHNLSSENIIAASDLGGLAAPSLAVARSDISDFSGFGEVTLLADPKLLNDSKARTFDADIYSPRQPRAVYDIDRVKSRDLYNRLDPDNLGLSKPDIQTLSESDGAMSLQRSSAFEYEWLQSQGIAPALKNKKVDPIVRRFAKTDLHRFDLEADEKFVKAVTKHYQSQLDDLTGKGFDVRAEKMSDWFFEEDGAIKKSKLRDMASEVQRFRDTKGKDVGQLQKDIAKKMRVKKNRNAYEQHVTETFNDLVTGKKIFKGFTNSGNRKHVPYNMVNVVKDMTQQLQAGENFFYGAGTVRSKYANEMKTIRQIQNKRDEIVSEEDMKKVKDESGDVFSQALDNLRPFYKFDGNSFGYMNDVGTAIVEGRRGMNEAFNMTPEAQTIVDDLLEYLVALPTSYFESKIQRAVDFNEFDTAVVPRDIRSDALQILKDAGLKIKKYDSKKEGSRAEVIAKQNQLLFQNNQGKTVRGYYDPANTSIRLTEAADLSTFLHEFAHFMYEMELKGDTDMVQSINNWYKRNAADVAVEANTYLGEKFDGLKQDIDDVTETESFKKWFGNSKIVENKNEPKIVFTGSYKSGFDVFDVSNVGAFFSDRFDIAASYSGTFDEVNFDSDPSPGVYETYLKIENPKIVDWDNNIFSEGPEGQRIDDEANTAKNEGFDGLIVENVIDIGPVLPGVIDDTGNGNVYVVFSSNQIKSATDNLGTFDLNNPSILAQNEPPTGKEGSITEADVVAFLDQTTTGDKDKDLAIRRAVHEQFARGFEEYLMEGKAPSIELRNAFRAFARWLARIYQALRGNLNVNLTDDMRQVFDRLLATEDQIQAAEARARVEPLFTDAAMAGMTEQEFTDYQARQEKVKDVQSETLRDKIIKQLTRQTKAWWKEERQDLIDEEIQTLSTEQVYVANTRLKDGDIKLDHATVKEMAGEERTNKLNRKSVVIPEKLKGMTAKGGTGVHPDEAAAFFGYKSGSEMINDLITAPPIKTQATSNAEARMIETHGDILNDGAIEQEADEAVRNEERGKLILHELKMLARGTNAPTVDRATIKAVAEERIGKLSFRQINPGKYRKAEIAAAQESARMLALNNREGAASAKLRQVTNYYLGMAATNAKNETVKIVDRMARYNKKNVREEIQKAEGGYWDQIVKILNRFEFRKSATLKQVESINTWAKERMEVDGDALVLSNAVLNESFVTHWKNVPFTDLQGVNDSVKNIEHVARYSNKLTRMQEEIDFNKLVDKWVTSMDENVKTRFVSKRTSVVEGRNWGRWFMAQMTKVPFMASWLDGGERAGLSHQIMVQPFTDAYNAEIKLWDKAGKPVMDAILDRDKETIKRHNQKIYIPEIDDHLFGHQILAVALNTGNESNLTKLLTGEGWANPEDDADINFDNAKLQAVLSHMSKSDWQMVQLIWDQMETLYPQLAEVHRRTTGLVPPKIQPTPITVSVLDENSQPEQLTLKGGYYPVKYDPNRDHRAQLNEDKLNAEIESMFSNSASIQASVNAGATNERTKYFAPIRLSLDVVSSHFQETIHYITHHDPVREVNRLTRNKRVAEVIKEKLGPEEYAQLKPWLNDIAKDGREAPTKMFWDDMLQRLRFGVTLGVMGFKASTGIIQISGLSNTIAEVGIAPVMQSMKVILGSTTTIKQAWDFAIENSKVLEHRAQTMDREIKNAMKKIESKRGILAAAQEASMKHIALIQTYMVDLPSWHAAYIKGMNDWGDETRSFQYADWVIENVQGSGATKDLAKIMRGQSESGRMFTMFMTFFSSLWNMERDLVKGARSGLYSTTTVAAKAMFLFTVPVLFEMMMRGELGEPDEGDDDDRLQRMLLNTVAFPIQSIPFIRDVANATVTDFGYNISPLQSIIEQGTRSIPELVARGFTDEEITLGQKKGSTKFIGAVLGVPGVNQAWATGEHLYDVIVEGEELTMHQLLFGPERE